MSDHKVELTELEKSGLHKHGLQIGCPSQLSDSFRHGVKFALNNAGQKLEQAEARVAEMTKTIDSFIAATQLAEINGYGQDSAHKDDSWIDALSEAFDRARVLRQKADEADKPGGDL
jgi:hypothetical protein